VKKILVTVAWVLSLGLTPAANAEDNPAAAGFDAAGSGARAVAIADVVMHNLGGRGNWDAVQCLAWEIFGRKHLWNKWTGDYRLEDGDLLVIMNVPGPVVVDNFGVERPAGFDRAIVRTCIDDDDAASDGANGLERALDRANIVLRADGNGEINGGWWRHCAHQDTQYKQREKPHVPCDWFARPPIAPSHRSTSGDVLGRRRRVSCARCREDRACGLQDVVDRDLLDGADLWVVVSDEFFGQKRFGEKEVLAHRGRQCGPAVIGGAEERDDGRAQRGSDVARAGVVGDEQGGVLEDGFERAECHAALRKIDDGRFCGGRDGAQDIGFTGRSGDED
jgi:hypothetical protein